MLLGLKKKLFKLTIHIMGVKKIILYNVKNTKEI